MNIKKAIGTWLVKSLNLNEMISFVRREQGLSDSKVTRPYSQVEFVFICINKLIQSISGLNLVISTIDDKVVESGPVIDLLFGKKDYTWQKIVQEWVGHWALSNDVFIAYTDEDSSGVSAIQIINGSQMRAITNNGAMSGLLVGWEFCGLYGERKKFDLTQVHQTMGFNPYNKFHGQSPLGPAANSVDYSFAASLYNAASLNNGAEPGPIFMLEGSPDEIKIRAFLDNFESRHGGPKQTNKPSALSGVKDIKTIARTMADMQVAEISKMSDTKICTVFGVPGELVGLGTETQYSHGPAQRAFMFYTILPLAKFFADELTASVLDKFYPSTIRAVDFAKSKMFSGVKFAPVQRMGYLEQKQKAIKSNKQLFAWFDIEQHPTIEEAKRESTEKILGFTDKGITLNNLIEVHDLPYDQVSWGDDWWIGMGQVPARYALEAGLEGLTGPLLPEGGTEEPPPPEPGKSTKTVEAEQIKADEIQRLRIWRNWVISWLGIEREYDEALRKFFLRQQRELLEKLANAMQSAKSASNKDSSDEIIARVVFDLKKENGKIRAINQTFFQKASELGIRQIAAEAGITGDALKRFIETARYSAAVRRALIIQAQKIQGVNTVTQRMVANQLRDGLAKGEGLPDLTNRVKHVLGENRARAQAIARTQTGGAVSSGRHVGIKQAGFDLKIWLDSHDKDVRDTHKTAGKLYAKGIPVDEAFAVGGDFLMHPGDPAGSPAEVINCRCVELAAKSNETRALVFERYANLKFYSYEDMKKALSATALATAEA